MSPRLFSLIVNLIERKNDNWKDRLTTSTGPQSMQNLHKQHEQEMKATQMEIAQYDDHRGGNKGGRSGGGGGYEKTNKHGGSNSSSGNSFNNSSNQYVPKNDKGSKRQHSHSLSH